MTDLSLKDWVFNLDENILNFLDSLKTDDYEYSPLNSGVTEEGRKIKLGFSCYALKIKYILNDNDINNDKYLKEAELYLNSYQRNNIQFPDNSYIDKNFLLFHKNPKINKVTKEAAKKMINLINKDRYLDKNTVLRNYIRAETKQAISTLYQIGHTNKIKYTDFPHKKKEIEDFLDNQNWRYPWNAGAQFSTLCVFSKTQLEVKVFEEVKLNLETYINKISDKETGTYFQHKMPNSKESINGAMKVITGLDWLDMEIHYPDNLIDFCLESDIELEGCDIVDIVYVMYKCSQQTNYKRKEVITYLNNLVEIIKLNYLQKEGAFSYYFQSSQRYYYGLKISKGLKTADIHGSLLLLWALSMIFEITELETKNWNILKP